MKLEKREEILKQQEELFIKIDDLKQKKKSYWNKLVNITYR